MDPDAVSTVDRAVHGGDADVEVDCSANTNPRTPPGVDDVYADALSASRRYPDDSYADFRAAAASHVDAAVDADQVVPTAGGTQALRLAFGVSVRPGDTVLVPTPGFAEYAREVRLQGGTPVEVAHDAVADADPTDHAACVVCTPNNPTGESTPPDDLRALAARCREAETTLVVDEAFLDFTSTPSVAGTPGVVVARSLTKLFGLPGLRAGFAVATDDVRDRLERARPAWNLSTPAARVGAHCLRQAAFVADTRERVAAERERLRAGLVERGYDPWPSDAPFLLVDVGARDVDGVLDRALAAGVRLRDCRSFGLDSHVRVAVKGPRETDRVLAALADGDTAVDTDGDADTDADRTPDTAGDEDG